jgi:hypothetical protein
MLHHSSQWPRGTIGPAHALLLPPQHANDAAAPPADGEPGPAAPVRLVLWLHPAAYHEALAMLQRLCQQPEHAQQHRQPAAAPGGGVAITPLSRHLRRLELRGPSATGLLTGLLPAIKPLTSPPAPTGTPQMLGAFPRCKQPEPHASSALATDAGRHACRHGPGMPDPGPSAGRLRV